MPFARDYFYHHPPASCTDPGCTRTGASVDASAEIFDPHDLGFRRLTRRALAALEGRV